ncbi:MAG: hypothetical protein KME26_29330 [Oscillatoria princeps RMCB-10]|nr:hypothetical protein [Oscillatoria princeps RMCB-10]
MKKIEQEIAGLERETLALAQELHSTYSSYLTALGQAMRQQLILASYHICSQGYPESFLKLSYSQRKQLQQELRLLATSAQQQLQEMLHSPGGGHAEPKAQQLQLESPESELRLGRTRQEDAQSSQLNNPEQLAQWQENLDLSLAKILQAASRRANRLLQQTGILPKKLPEQVLEAAAKAEAAAETVPGPPNLLNLLIETEGSEDSSGSTVTQLLAIHLRLSEIEFSDSQLGSWRSQIRKLSVRVSKLVREYQKKQRERAVAEAESAWRSSWADE